MIRGSRRQFVAGMAALGMTGVGAADLLAAQSPVASGPLSESPLLTSQVEAGTLPPVAERLPQQPLVVQPVDRVGDYGGTWRSAIVGGLDNAWLLRCVGYDNLLRWDAAWTEAIPNIAQSYEVSEDGKTFTFTLRAGHRWSDGAPFTSADIAFYAEAVYGNDELTPVKSGNPWTLDVIDETTFSVTFERPNGLFVPGLAGPDGAIWTRFPRHYLEPFHPDYNTTDLDQRVSDAGFETWVQLFQSKASSITGTSSNAVWENVDLPRLNAWKLQQPFVDGSRVVLDRNPFYFKVDPDGNQLPYLDAVSFDGVQDNEVLLLKVLSGELDFHVRHINTNLNKPVIVDGAESGGYRLFSTIPTSMNTVTLSFNHTHKDPVMRSVLADKNFRVGLSHAINRQEIIDAVYVGQGQPWQCAPRPESAFYHEELASQYTAFDLDAANAALDLVIPDRDGDGWRLRPDGSAFAPIIEVASSGTVSPVDATNLVVQHWREVGINAQLSPIDRSLLVEHKNNGDFDCVVWQGDAGLGDAWLNNTFYAPVNYEFAPSWARWFDENTGITAPAEEPPAEVKAQLDLITTMRETVDPDEQHALMMQVLDAARDQFYVIGVSLTSEGYGIARTNFLNVPDPMYDAYLYPTPGPTNPEQYFFEGGAPA